MNEKAYKAMNFAGISGIVTGIIVAVVGVTAGVITIVGGARLLKEKRGLTFQACVKGVCIWDKAHHPQEVWTERKPDI